MSDSSSRRRLIGRAWTHSHEEDHDGLAVYRPSERDFPPARGRDSFDLSPDGALIRSAPGPDDRTQRTAGSWTIDGDRLDLYPAASPAHHLSVVDLGPDILTVRPASGPARESGGSDGSV